jgi:hypothetical protein
MAVVFIFLGDDDVASKVSGNKINPFFYYADLLLPTSDSIFTGHRRDLLSSDPQPSLPTFFSMQQPTVLLLSSTARQLLF